VGVECVQCRLVLRTHLQELIQREHSLWFELKIKRHTESVDESGEGNRDMESKGILRNRRVAVVLLLQILHRFLL
jgi:hypothetical protein